MKSFRHFNFAIDAQVRSVPVAASFQSHDFVRLHSCHDVVVVAEPLVTRVVHPPHVVASVRRSALVSHHCDELVMAGVEARPVGSVEHRIRNLDLFLLFQLLQFLAHCAFLFLLLLVLLAGLVLHLNVGHPSQPLGVLFLPKFALELPAQVEAFFELLSAKLVDVEDLGEGHSPQNLGLACFGPCRRAFFLPVKPHELNRQIRWLYKNEQGINLQVC